MKCVILLARVLVEGRSLLFNYPLFCLLKKKVVGVCCNLSKINHGWKKENIYLYRSLISKNKLTDCEPPMKNRV